MRARAAAALLLGALALAGCGSHDDSLVEPGASLNCKGLNFNATIANADGAATLTKVLVTSDGDPYTYTLTPPGGPPAASIGMTVSFRYATVGMHTVKVVVAEQTASPSRYRVSGDSTQLLACQTAQGGAYQSGPLPTRTATLATGESVSYDFQF